MPSNKPRGGFTLVEIALVTVVIGILAALAAPRVGGIRVQASLGVLRADLRNLATAEEFHRTTTGGYVPLNALTNFTPSGGVLIDFVWLKQHAFAARGLHARAPGWECWILSGGVPAGHAPPDGYDAPGVQCLED